MHFRHSTPLQSSANVGSQETVCWIICVLTHMQEGTLRFDSDPHTTKFWYHSYRNFKDIWQTDQLGLEGPPLIKEKPESEKNWTYPIFKR